MSRSSQENPMALEAPKSPVAHYDASVLDRPQRHAPSHFIFIGLAALIACALGLFGMYQAYETIVLGPELEEERTVSALEKEVYFNFPQMLQLIDLTDAGMHDALLAEDNTLLFLESYAPNPEDSEGFDLYRIPTTLSLSTADGYLTKGIGNLKTSQAATFLNGAWRLTCYRYLACAIRLQYADLKATNAQEAIANALDLQGWNDPDTFTENGVDANGNTFQAGYVEYNGNTYEWRVSTVSLEEMYGLGLPTDAMFVGIRLTQILK